METFKCRTCKGTGKRWVWYKQGSKIFYEQMECIICRSTGQFDWIDNIRKNVRDYGYFVEDVFLSDTGKLVLPKLRSVYPKIIAEELVSIQPMTGVELNYGI